MRRKAYLAGPMRGIPLYNFPAFDAARDRLVDRGWDVISPADLDRAVGLDPADLPPDHDWRSWGEASPNSTIKRDIAGVLESDALFLLPGWENSVGAKAEVGVATWAGLPVTLAVEYLKTGVLTDSPEAHAPDGAEMDMGTHAGRKRVPVASGVLAYFPQAIRAIAHCSWVGNEQHNPGEPLHWARDKSGDHDDCLIRHFMEAGTVDTDGVRHTTKMAWRSLAKLELELEAALAKS